MISLRRQSLCSAHTQKTVVQRQLHTHLWRMRPLMGSRASYTVRASFTQSVGSMRKLVMVRRIREPGTAVSFRWQLKPPQDEKMFKGTFAPGRLAYILSTHCDPERGTMGGGGGGTPVRETQHCYPFITETFSPYLLSLMSNLSAEQLQEDTTIRLSPFFKHTRGKKHR